MDIIFGTDGWRGKIGDVFTDSNLKIVAQAVCDYLLDQNVDSKFVVVGFDNRFRSEDYAQIVAEVFAGNGFEVLLGTRPVSTPVVSFVTHRFKAAIGICITASHNPAYYNGFKIKENFGGSALTKTIEKIKPFIYKTNPRQLKSNITKVDLSVEYIQNLQDLFDLNRISSFFETTPIHLNYMHGSSAGYVGKVFSYQYIPTLEYNLNRDPLFGGVNPEPIPLNLKDFIQGIHSGLGFAFDGDGDRIAAVTSTKQFVSSSQLMAILLPHLRTRSKADKAIFTVSCSALPRMVAKDIGLEVLESKIGFKYIADTMLEDSRILIGGEESGGIGFIDYLPERDGIAVCLMVLEALATAQKPLEILLEDLELEYGPLVQDRLDVQVQDTMITAQKISMLAESPETLLPDVTQVNTLDGVKLLLPNGAWLMLRQSGTEPVVRIYAESESAEKTQELIKKGLRYLQ